MGKYATGITVASYWDERAPLHRRFLRVAREIRRLLPHQADPAGDLPHRRCGRLQPDLCDRDAEREEHPARAGARGARRGDYKTFYSRIKFTPQGDGDAVIMGAWIGQVQKGEVEIVYPESARTAAAAIYPVPPWDGKA